jgi:hypothetical protein
MKISVPFSTVSTDLADMIDLLCFHGCRARAPRLRPCPSARPGVASARATRAEGDRPPVEPLDERVCTSEWLTAKIQDVRERGRPGRPPESAPVLAGASPWRARGAEPLSLFHEKEPHRPSASEATWWRDEKKQPEERQHSAAVRRDAGTTAIPRPVKKAPAGGSASRTARNAAGPGTECLRRGYVIAREGSMPLAETLRGSVHESPVRRLPHARKKVLARTN